LRHPASFCGAKRNGLDGAGLSCHIRRAMANTEGVPRRIAREVLELRRAVGARIAAVREARGMTQRTLAERSSIPRYRLSRIETGNYAPLLEDFPKLREALGVSVDALVMGGTAGREPRDPRLLEVLQMLESLAGDPDLDRVVRLLRLIVLGLREEARPAGPVSGGGRPAGRPASAPRLEEPARRRW
jgi:transcriptional regulator with XRE-family HTH domain